jgi:hypothetical protein
MIYSRYELNFYIFSPMTQQPLVCQDLLIIEASRSRSDISHSVGISPSNRTLPDNTQHSQETDIHAPGGIRTQNPSKRAVADPRLILHWHWDGHVIIYIYKLKSCSLGRVRCRNKSPGTDLFSPARIVENCVNLRYRSLKKEPADFEWD